MINLGPGEEKTGGWQYCFLICPSDLILINECEPNYSLIDVLWANLLHKYAAEEANKMKLLFYFWFIQTISILIFQKLTKGGGNEAPKGSEIASSHNSLMEMPSGTKLGRKHGLIRTRGGLPS